MSTPRGLEVIVDPDCGNAPRKAQVRDWLIAFASGDVDAVCAELSDDVTWEIAGAAPTSGIDAVRSQLEALADHDVSALTIRPLISHGKEFAAEGTLTVGGSNERFAYVLTWSSHAKTADISYVLNYRA